MKTGIDRRTLLKGAALSTVTALGGDLFGGRLLELLSRRAWAQEASEAVLAVVRDGAPAAMVRAAVDALGGMGKFVRPGEVVVVKPNLGWDRTPEQAANTNPEVVKAVAELCIEAGARRVRVMDRPCNDPRRCYKRSGAKDAVASIGNPAVTIEHLDERKFTPLTLKEGSPLGSWTFYKEVLEADKIINVPIAKHHNASRLTMSLKNIMGVLGGNRGNIHHDLDLNIAYLNSVLRFDLVVMDAVRILLRNGPQGGRVSDVREMHTIVAGTDPVAVDSFGATLFGITARDVPHVLHAARLGLGEADLGKVSIRESRLG